MSGLVSFAILFSVASGVALAAVTVARARGALRTGNQPLRIVVTSAMHEAHARGHAKMTHVHLALALTFDPEVEGRLAHVGPVDELRDRLDAFLRDHHDKEPREAFEVATPDPDSPTILLFVAELAGPTTSRSPARYLTVLMEAMAKDPAVSPDVHAIFESFGLTKASWRASGVAVPTEERSAAAGLPYRSSATPTGDHRLRFWNDDKTTQAIVVHLLTGTFGRSVSEARDLMLRTHLLGSAAFGALPVEEAEVLAKAAKILARDAGFPLRITVEPRSVAEPTPEPSRFWRRFFSRGPLE